MRRAAAGLRRTRDDHVGPREAKDARFPRGSSSTVSPVVASNARRRTEAGSTRSGSASSADGVSCHESATTQTTTPCPGSAAGAEQVVGSSVERFVRVPEVRDARERRRPQLVPGPHVDRAQRAGRVTGLLPQDQRRRPGSRRGPRSQRPAVRRDRRRPRHLGCGGHRREHAGKPGQRLGPRALRTDRQRGRDGDRDGGHDDGRDGEHPVPTDPAEDAPRTVEDDTAGAVHVVDGRGGVTSSSCSTSSTTAISLRCAMRPDATGTRDGAE